MQILPAIDLKGGKVVRLVKGDFQKETIYDENPVAVAKRWEGEGARWIHVVDLDGAFQGEPINQDWVREITRSVSCSIEAGGGVRTAETVEALLSFGVKRVVLGTKALTSEIFLQECVRDFGSRIAVSIDARENKLAVKGWTETLSMDALTMAKRLEAIGVSYLICTDIGRDGTMEGPSLSAAQNILNATSIPLIVSGGISSLEDIQAVKKLEGREPWGVIVGRALYENRFSLKTAMSC